MSAAAAFLNGGIPHRDPKDVVGFQPLAFGCDHDADGAALDVAALDHAACLGKDTACAAADDAAVFNAEAVRDLRGIDDKGTERAAQRTVGLYLEVSARTEGPDTDVNTEVDRRFVIGQALALLDLTKGDEIVIHRIHTKRIPCLHVGERMSHGKNVGILAKLLTETVENTVDVKAVVTVVTDGAITGNEAAPQTRAMEHRSRRGIDARMERTEGRRPGNARTALKEGGLIVIAVVKTESNVGGIDGDIHKFGAIRAEEVEGAVNTYVVENVSDDIEVVVSYTTAPASEGVTNANRLFVATDDAYSLYAFGKYNVVEGNEAVDFGILVSFEAIDAEDFVITNEDVRKFSACIGEAAMGATEDGEYGVKLYGTMITEDGVYYCLPYAQYADGTVYYGTVMTVVND